MKRKTLKKQKEESSIEDISSEGENGPKSNSEISFEKEEIDIDEHRLQLAKKILKEARMNITSKKIKQSSVASNENEETSSQEAFQVNKILQEKVAEKNKTQDFAHFEQIRACYQKNNQKFEEIVLKAHLKPITAICFNPFTGDLVSVAKDGAVILFDKASGFKRRLLSAGAPKNSKGHTDELLCLDVSFDGKYLVTAGKDKNLKVWDLGRYSNDLLIMKKNIAKGDFAIKTKHSSLIISHRKLSTEISDSKIDDLNNLLASVNPMISKNEPYIEKHPELVLLLNLSGHRDAIHSVKFRHNSHECVTASADRSLKVWDVAQGGLIETLFGHKSDMLDIDVLGEHVVSVGLDKLPIVFKLDRETQMIFDDQLFSLDCVKALNQHFFITGSQDGNIALWNVGKKRPLKTLPAHSEKGWVSALGGVYNSDFIVSGGCDSDLKFWKFSAKNIKSYSLEMGFAVKVEGVVNCIAVSKNAELVAVAESPENRLGRWTVCENVKSKIRVFKVIQ